MTEAEKAVAYPEGTVIHPSMFALFQAMTTGSQEGEMWVGMDQTYYTKPDIDWEKIRDVSKNHLITEQLERLTALLFMERPEFKVLDENGEEDEELSEQMAAMMNARDVRAYRAMQQVWVDVRVWGCALFNPVWKRDKSKVDLVGLRRLPPESFGEGPLGGKQAPGRIYSQILQGITLADPKDENSIEFWQSQALGAAPVQLKNVWMVTHPTATELGGNSRLAPLLPIVEAYNFCHKALMQYVNRTGAPIVFIRFTKPPAPVTPARDDIALAQRILTNWGKDTAYMLRENMEVHTLDLKVTGSAMEALVYFERRIKAYMSPATIIATEGPTLGEGTEAKLDVVKEWQKGEHEWLETEFEELGNLWLEHNAFSGPVSDFNIPEPTPDSTETDMLRAEKGFTTQSMLKDEIRELLGLDPLSEEEREVLTEEYASAAPPASPFGFGGAPAAQFQEQTEEVLTLEARLAKAGKEAEDRVMDILSRAMASAREEGEQP